jgi:hypothetical protein
MDSAASTEVKDSKKKKFVPCRDRRNCKSKGSYGSTPIQCTVNQGNVWGLYIITAPVRVEVRTESHHDMKIDTGKERE